MGFGLEHGHLMHQRICKQCGTRRLVSGAVQQLSDAHDVFDLAVLRRPAGGLLSAVCKLVQGAADVEVQTPRSASSAYFIALLLYVDDFAFLASSRAQLLALMQQSNANLV